jgi:hypothetical protein
VRLEGLGKLRKSTSSGTQTSDLPDCGVVPQPTTLPYAPPLCMNPMKSTAFAVYRGMFTDRLPGSGCPILVQVVSHRNVFTESLPSSGFLRHNIISFCNLLHNGSVT